MTGMRDCRPLGHIKGPEDFAAAFAVSRETLERLEEYAALLRQWQKAVNLVASSTLDDIWHRHFADSAQLVALLPGVERLLDLGSGAGFPGLVIAMLLAEAPAARVPGRRVVLIESNLKKCAFLAEVARRSGILSRIAVDILSTRCEEAATQVSVGGAEVITARALAPLDRLLAWAAPLFSPGTVGVFLKGRGVAAEREVAQKMWNFSAELLPSRTEPDGQILIIRRPEKKGKANRDRRTARG